ncbi:MAG: creatininase family protein [Bacteroidota bacterium]
MSELSMMTWKEIRRASSDGDAMVVVPVASLEQHGPHLAVQTDTLITSRVVAAVDQQLQQRGLKCYLAPTLWLGCSPHHLDLFTISLNPEIYVQVLVNIGDSLLTAGFQRIFFLNGHGGNSVPTQMAVNILGLKSKALIGCGTYWELAQTAIRELRESAPGGTGHACELETSIVQYLLPEAARQGLAVPCYPKLSPNSVIDMTESGPIKLGVRFSDLNPDGNLGDPSLASPEKGRRFFEAIVASVTDQLVEFSQLSVGNRATGKKNN